MEAEFNEKLKVWRNDQTNNFILSSAEYEDLWKKVTSLNGDERQQDYQMVRRFKIHTILQEFFSAQGTETISNGGSLWYSIYAFE